MKKKCSAAAAKAVPHRGPVKKVSVPKGLSYRERYSYIKGFFESTNRHLTAEDIKFYAQSGYEEKSEDDSHAAEGGNPEHEPIHEEPGGASGAPAGATYCDGQAKEQGEKDVSYHEGN